MGSASDDTLWAAQPKPNLHKKGAGPEPKEEGDRVLKAPQPHQVVIKKLLVGAAQDELVFRSLSHLNRLNLREISGFLHQDVLQGHSQNTSLAGEDRFHGASRREFKVEASDAAELHKPQGAEASS